MALNSTQSKYLSDVRTEVVDVEEVLTAVASAPDETYATRGFREFLFALDGCECIEDPVWYDLFCRRLRESSGWIVGDKLCPGALAEIGEFHRQYGEGVESLHLVLDFGERLEQLPANMSSFTRRVLREYFDGIHPMQSRQLAAMVRYVEANAITSQIVELLLHVNDNIKGLSNSDRYSRFFAKTLRSYVSDGDDKPYASRVEMISSYLERAVEPGEPEAQTIRGLFLINTELPEAILNKIDLRKERLFGRL